MTSHTVVQWFFALTALCALAASVWIYFIQKDYTFIVEIPCDPLVNECFVRDCEAGDCPPEGLSSYREFAVPAALFDSCTTATCENVCLSGSACEEHYCREQTDILCVYPDPTL